MVSNLHSCIRSFRHPIPSAGLNPASHETIRRSEGRYPPINKTGISRPFSSGVGGIAMSRIVDLLAVFTALVAPGEMSDGNDEETMHGQHICN